MKMFLTGASGDIGTAIKKKFKKEGYKIVCPMKKCWIYLTQHV